MKEKISKDEALKICESAKVEIEQKSIPKTDSQRNAYQLVFNNSNEHEESSHLAIKKTLVDNFTTLDYYCMADEVGNDTHTYHTHLYVHFTSRVRFSTIKRHFPRAHIVAANGTALQNKEYITKTGKWKNTSKCDTQVSGTFEEFGSLPNSHGKDSTLAKLYELIYDGYTNAEILTYNPDYIKIIDKLDKVRTTILYDRFKTHRRLDLKVIYISGHTGTGKTRYVLDYHGDENVFVINDYQHPFDSYSIQSVMCFDEFRSQLPMADMLRYLDIYPLELPARYANKFMCATVIYIISNWKLEMQYSQLQEADPKTWEAFLRRIHEVRIFNQDGTIDYYDSVEEYMNRSYVFHEIKNEDCENNPFTQERLLL